HDPAITLIQTGNQAAGHPCLGSWLNYGLGTMNRNLPSFVVLNCEPRGQALYSRLWGSGYLPSRHAGVAFRSQGDPVLYLSNPAGVSREVRRVMIERLKLMNEAVLARGGDPETRARIAQYEMAFRMQASVPELVDISGETKRTLEMYGKQATQPGTFAANCLLARRMAERDVRFIQVFHRGWDHHGSLPKSIRRQAAEVDQPAWALVQDLKQRGLLDDTLVIWGGEFGRTVYSQGTLTRSDYGRDHHPRCYSMWFAGGGTAGGVSHGQTDDFSYNIVENPVHIRDLNATILHLLGIDHRRLSVKYQGLDQRLTGVLPARVVRPILA
ncbi:MAG TPA: sulfatase, partial [Planctomycetaceae bacterium]|nr:sulfatase [Planctomycetaceae bacterium]